MKILFTLISLSIGILLSSESVQAQARPDSVVRKPRAVNVQQQKQQQRSYYRRALKVDSLKAEQVGRIQDEYKAGMKAVIEDQRLNQQARQARMKALVEEKNRKLSAILTPEQQSRIIPSTEREAGRGQKKD